MKDLTDTRIDNLDTLRRTTGWFRTLAARMKEIEHGAETPLKREARIAFREYLTASRDRHEVRALRARQRFAAASQALRQKEAAQ